jgi:hypothetical protein
MKKGNIETPGDWRPAHSAKGTLSPVDPSFWPNLQLLWCICIFSTEKYQFAALEMGFLLYSPLEMHV